MAESSSASSEFPRDPVATCASHERLERKIDAGFRDVNRRFDDLFRDLGAREEAAKTQGREIGELKKKADSVPRMIAAAVSTHKGQCAIGDITKTELRLPEPERGRRSRREEPEIYETPPHGTHRRSHSLTPGPFFKIPIPRMIVYVALALGIAVSAGLWIWRLLEDTRGQIPLPAATSAGVDSAPATTPTAPTASLLP